MATLVRARIFSSLLAHTQTHTQTRCACLLCLFSQSSVAVDVQINCYRFVAMEFFISFAFFGQLTVNPLSMATLYTCKSVCVCVFICVSSRCDLNSIFIYIVRCTRPIWCFQLWLLGSKSKNERTVPKKNHPWAPLFQPPPPLCTHTNTLPPYGATRDLIIFQNVERENFLCSFFHFNDAFA